MRELTIGSRGSDLALWQANHVKAQIEKLGLKVNLKIIITQGDAIQNLSFDKLEGKGFFTKEIENELLDNKIDLAVHSHKDLETNPPAGLLISAVSERENPAELLLINKTKVDSNNKWNLASNASIGTSSARRKSLVKAFRADLEIKELRGNVPTRIQKLKDGHYDAILLAKAGVDRLQLDLSDFHVEILDPTEFVPAPAQGVLGFQIREEDDFMKSVLRNLNHKKVKQVIDIERKILNLMDGGCQLPLGVYCPDVNNAFVAYSKSSLEAAQTFHFDLTQMQSPAEEIVAVLKKI